MCVYCPITVQPDDSTVSILRIRIFSPFESVELSNGISIDTLLLNIVPCGFNSITGLKYLSTTAEPFCPAITTCILLDVASKLSTSSTDDNVISVSAESAPLGIEIVV